MTSSDLEVYQDGEVVIHYSAYHDDCPSLNHPHGAPVIEIHRVTGWDVDAKKHVELPVGFFGEAWCKEKVRKELGI